MQRPGFNIECTEGNNARWGYCANCPNQGCQLDDLNDADASIGIGLKGQATSVEMGAGWTELFATGPGTCGSISGNSKVFKRIWVSVQNSEGKYVRIFSSLGPVAYFLFIVSHIIVSLNYRFFSSYQ